MVNINLTSDKINEILEKCGAWKTWHPKTLQCNYCEPDLVYMLRFFEQREDEWNNMEYYLKKYGTKSEQRARARELQMKDAIELSVDIPKDEYEYAVPYYMREDYSVAILKQEFADEDLSRERRFNPLTYKVLHIENNDIWKIIDDVVDVFKRKTEERVGMMLEADTEEKASKIIRILTWAKRPSDRLTIWDMEDWVEFWQKCVKFNTNGNKELEEVLENLRKEIR